MNNYEVAFSGELVSDTDIEKAQENVAKIFNMDAKQIMALFSGRRIVIRSGVSEVEANKYVRVLYQAGIVVEVRDINKPAAAPAAALIAESIPEAPVASPAIPAITPAIAPVQAPETPAAELTISELEAPVRMQERAPRPAADLTQYDTSALSLAPLDSDFEELPSSKDKVQIKASQDSYAESDNDQQIDTSHLSLAPLGSELEEIPSVKDKVKVSASDKLPTEEPDARFINTSHLSLAPLGGSHSESESSRKPTAHDDEDHR